MAKFVITEEQFNLIKKELSEDVKDVKDDRYQRSIKVDVDTYDATINGETIDWAVSDKIQLSYLIDVEFKSWGIKDINLYDIQGPSEIEVVITPQVEDAEDVVVTVSCDWENIPRCMPLSTNCIFSTLANAADAEIASVGVRSRKSS